MQHFLDKAFLMCFISRNFARCLFLPTYHTLYIDFTAFNPVMKVCHSLASSRLLALGGGGSILFIVLMKFTTQEMKEFKFCLYKQNDQLDKWHNRRYRSFFFFSVKQEPALLPPLIHWLKALFIFLPVPGVRKYVSDHSTWGAQSVIKYNIRAW